MAGWLHGDQRRAADDLRGRGAAGGRRARRPRPRILWRDLGIVVGCRDRRARAGRRDAAPPHRLTVDRTVIAGQPVGRPIRTPEEGLARWHGPAGARATRTPGRRSSTRPARRSPSRASTARRSGTIATGAGVDPALVHHYFGTKDQLFLATVERADRPGRVRAGRARRRRRAASASGWCGMFLSVWDDPRAGAAAARPGPQRAAARLVGPDAAGVRGTPQILRRVIARLDLPPAEAPIRAALVASQMLGLGMARYMLEDRAAGQRRRATSRW